MTLRRLQRKHLLSFPLTGQPDTKEIDSQNRVEEHNHSGEGCQAS